MRDCLDDDLACSDPSGGAPSCVCATPDSTIVVDTTVTYGTAAPTGASSPASCRFKTITEALSYAKDVWRPAHGGAPVTVKTVGSPTVADPAVFDAESFPITVPTSVTLTSGSQSPSPEFWVIAANAQAATNVLELEGGATIEGFTLRSLSATGDGLAVLCDADTATAVARSVRIDGNGVARYGASVSGGCGLDASDLVITGATKSGILVNTASPAVGVTVTGGSVHGNGESGAEVLGGLLVIRGRTSGSGDVLFDLGPNARHAVRVAPVGPSPKAVDVRLDLVDVHENGEVGMFVKYLGTTSKVHVTSSRIRKNTGTAAYSIYGAGRLAGGVLLWGDMPSEFEFQRNTVCSNATDQIGVYSNDRWNLSAADCTASNVFVRPGSGYYVYSTTELPDVEVPAINNRWAPNPPGNLVVKTAISPSCGAVTTVPSFCQ